MSTLTVAFAPYVDTDTSTTTRHASVTLTSVGVQPREKLYPQEIQGLADGEQPITFTISRFARKKVIDDLLPHAASFVARAPRRTLDGFLDAVVNDGAELAQFTWSETDRRDGSTYSQSEWGFYRVQGPQVAGARESLQLVLYPVNRLRFVNSSTYLSDADYN